MYIIKKTRKGLKKDCNRYQDLSGEREKIWEYGHEQYKNLSEEKQWKKAAGWLWKI